MRDFINNNRNKGFSLVELIVVIAIMAVMIGVISISVSLLIGSEAKSGSQKLSAQLDEVKTGAMSRYDESLTIIYVDNPDAYDWADKEGFYVVKCMSTMGEDETGKTDASDPAKVGIPKTVVLGEEHRYICNAKAQIFVQSVDASGANLSNEITTAPEGITFSIDRSDGTYADAMAGSAFDATNGNVMKIGAINIGKPTKIVFTNGSRKYSINILSTGKHTVTQE